jgi:hypothetical protein
VLSGALELWRGAPLADVSPTPMMIAHAHRVGGGRLDALEAWVDGGTAWSCSPGSLEQSRPGEGRPSDKGAGRTSSGR